MSVLIILVVLCVCLVASTVGAICGVGGGVIIKPVLDAMQIMTVQQVSFLSGCTVLCMSAYSVFCSARRDNSSFEAATILPLGVGAALGGLAGGLLFQYISRGSGVAAFVQSACLLLLLLGMFVYTLFEKRIRTRAVKSPLAGALIGLFLGFFSAFLGIGGGPFNLVVLSFFFSMDTKTAARHSLCIILVSQAVSLLYSFVSASVPPVSPLLLLVMAAGGVGGGVLGRRINRRLSGEGVRKLFLGLSVVIMGVCAYNMLRA